MSEAKAPTQLDRRAYMRLVLLGAVIGLPAAAMAAAFLAVVHQLEDLLWHDLPEALDLSGPPWYLVIGLPILGAALVAAARAWLPGDGGHSPLDGVAGGPTPLSAVPGVAIAALGSLSFGAVLGPEAPLIALGSVAGLILVKFVPIGEKGEKVIDSAGSFAAISALFGGPVVAGIFMLEGGVGMGAALIPVLIPGFVAAAVGYLLFIGLGDWGGIHTQTLTVPNLPEYDGTDLVDLAVAIAVGVVAAVVIAAVRRSAVRVDGLSGTRFSPTVLLLAGGAAVGLLAQLADALGADSQDVLFSGQASIPALLAEDSTRILLILLVVKALGYAVCLGCGFRGGPVFPAIFIGVAIATFAVIVLDVSPTVALAAGAAAGMAAMTRMLVTSVLLGTMLTGQAGLDASAAAVLAAVTAWLVSSAIDARRAPEAPAEAVASE